MAPKYGLRVHPCLDAGLAPLVASVPKTDALRYPARNFVSATPLLVVPLPIAAPFNPISQLLLKLKNQTNFANWKSQVQSLIYGHDLYSYLDRTIVAPPKTTSVNTKEANNPLYNYATHHVTTESQGLQDYNGIEEIAMGDGNMIPISHTGNTQLSASNLRFKLSNSLCAPTIKCNLIPISKFCHNNLTFVEFFPTKFFVKDPTTEALLVCGHNREILYECPSGHHSYPHLPPKSSHFLTTKVPKFLWHRRLGHPDSRIFYHALNNFSLPYSTSKHFEFCNSCSCNKGRGLPFF
ncbi:hypothetical protein CDL12_30061 [Handroanthus impetiginosus]|uniref:GAG-pre-integrase domain-containing protein n=1 Tax=Handroanthus impetiginosus TaxID=429701 RepID=A0A2G9FWP0_9LAMI|nr:hypothetical protein CDL12_30061 [Handroanthus impetiginosus]